MTVLNGNKDKILGCIIGGAVGDALGYPVEFENEESIFHTYGDDGITEYELDPETNKALISDDTHPDTLISEGHMDHIIRCAVKEGLDPIKAIQ